MKYLKRTGIFLIAVLLLGLSAFSLSRYAPLLKAKQEIEKQNQEARELLVKLDSDLNVLSDRLEEQIKTNQQIHAENNSLKENFKKVQDDLNITNEQLEILTTSLLSLNRENAVLEENNQMLAERLESILEDKQSMLAKINSIQELKKMIVEIKKQVIENRAHLKKKIDERKLADGNKGFVVKDGIETYKQKINIEVNPAS